MKNTLFFLTLLTLLMSCSSDEKSIEQQLYECIEGHYSKHNIDLNASLDSLENYLIAEHILVDKTGKGKIQFYENIVNSGTIPEIKITPLMERLSKEVVEFDVFQKCVQQKLQLDSNEYKKSNYYTTTQKIQKSAIKNGGVTPVSVSQAFLKYLTAHDFELPIYRSQMLISYAAVADNPEAFRRTIPKKENSSQSSQDLEEGFIIDISTNGLIVDGKKVNNKELELALLNYLENFQETSHVRIELMHSTEYEALIKVHTEVENIYAKFWQQKAKMEYQTTFGKLEVSKQEILKEKYPLRFVEYLVK